jgi:hypothetical protein
MKHINNCYIALSELEDLDILDNDELFYFENILSCYHNMLELTKVGLSYNRKYSYMIAFHELLDSNKITGIESVIKDLLRKYTKSTIKNNI